MEGRGEEGGERRKGTARKDRRLDDGEMVVVRLIFRASFTKRPLLDHAPGWGPVRKAAACRIVA